MSMRLRLAGLVSSTAVLASLAIACGPAAPKTPREGESAESSESAAVAGPSDTAASNDDARGSHVGVHGMVLFGSERLYLSHIPLYSTPHNIQVVVEVKIASGVTADQQQFGTRNFTVKPTAFSLHDLAHGVLGSVAGTIYFGNFESGGTPAFRNVKFDVIRVLFERAMSPSMPVNASLDYIAVGTPAQPYLVHLIDAPPSFDHIVAVRLPKASFLDAASLETGTLVRIDGQTNSVTKRLKPQAIVNGLKLDADGSPSETDGATTSSTIEVVSESSCLPGRDFYGTCPTAQ
jgi:hypothetical protein